MLWAAPRAAMTLRWELTEGPWVLVEPVLRPARREDSSRRICHERFACRV